MYSVVHRDFPQNNNDLIITTAFQRQTVNHKGMHSATKGNSDFCLTDFTLHPKKIAGECS